MSAAQLRQRLQRGPLVLDGATGTELESRGVAGPAPLWSAHALLHAPEVVEAVHRDYVTAGADIIVANTFRTNPRTLLRAGLLDAGARLNALAIDLARRAAGQPGMQRQERVLVAASVGPVEDCYQPELVPGENELRKEHEQMARWLAAAKPDLIWIETVGTVREACAAAEAAAATGLPVVVSFLVQESGALLVGERLEEAVAAIEPLEPLAFGLNCIPPLGLSAVLPRLRRVTGRPLAAYAHINNPTPIRGWSFSQVVAPPEYAELAGQWLELGVSVVGGCCGTRPAHIQAVRAVVAGRKLI